MVDNILAAIIDCFRDAGLRVKCRERWQNNFAVRVQGRENCWYDVSLYGDFLAVYPLIFDHRKRIYKSYVPDCRRRGCRVLLGDPKSISRVVRYLKRRRVLRYNYFL
jgi:hypothetical protein